MIGASASRPLHRRDVLLGGLGGLGAAALVLGGWGGGRQAAAARGAQAGAPSIVPRSEWGAHLVPTGPIPDEPDVRFLLVHHTVNGNDYAPEQVVGILEQIFGFHTSPEKGWPDIAYNFLIDRFGTVYEGRTGSLAGAKAADATGGSQGFAQLCCFIGDHSVAPPSDAAFGSMVGMLAFLGDRHGLDLSPGATATFTSRGSNRRPAGTEVTTPTISGHRDMSSTACPGDFAYASVADGTFARLATEARSGAAAPATTAAPPVPETTATTAAPPPETATTAPAPSTSSSSTAAPAESATGAPVVADDAGGDGPALAVPAAVAGAAAAAVALFALRTRRPHP